MIPRPFEYRFTVQLHDTDAAGRLFFAHLFRHAHDAYEALMREIGQPLPPMIAAQTLLLPLTHAEADYLQPMQHGERICVEVEVLELRQRAFSLDYRFLDAAGRLAARARTVHVQIALEPGSARSLAPELRAALEPHLAAAPTE
ncbi:thioesterase family protein [Marichromatium sp. PS1]|uniref:acyl-CoA thioesterase n=1 Tax=Marichromatium sp. PS1 TaxID=3138932 RepID=UPI0032E5D7F5